MSTKTYEELESENHALYSHLAEADCGFGGWFASLSGLQSLLQKGDTATAKRLLANLLEDGCQIDHIKARDARLEAIIAARAVALLPRETQETIGEWGRETFPNFKGARNRVVAVLEEAVELAITEGLSREEIMRTVGVPLYKQEARGEAGDSEEEAADVDITLRAYAFEKGFQLHEATDKKMMINRLRPRDHYIKKTQAKVEMGLPKYEIPEPVTQETCPAHCICHTPGDGSATVCGTKTNMYHEACC